MLLNRLFIQSFTGKFALFIACSIMLGLMGAAGCKAKATTDVADIITLQVNEQIDPRSFAKKYEFLTFKALASRSQQVASFYLIDISYREAATLLGQDQDVVQIISSEQKTVNGQSGKKGTVTIKPKQQ